jgi:hypothetical protein
LNKELININRKRKKRGESCVLREKTVRGKEKEEKREKDK